MNNPPFPPLSSLQPPAVQTSGPDTVIKHGMTLRRRRDDDKYHVRIRFRNQVHFVTLADTPTKSARLALLARKEIHGGRWSDFKAKTQLRAEIPKTKLRDLESAYLKFPGPAASLTKARNIQALHRILAACDLDPAHATLDDLTADLLWTWKQRVLELANAAGNDDERSLQLRRSANSNLLQARSLFTDDALEYYRRESKLHLPPSLAAFRKESGFKKVAKEDYRAPADVVIAATFAALENLIPKESTPDDQSLNMFKACWLAIGFGLRAGEISKAKNADFQRVAGDIFFRPAWRAKNKRLPEIGCQLDTWQRIGPWIESAASPDAYVIAGTDTERTSLVFRRISDWMRSLGWQTTHHLHELRAWAGCQIASNHPQGLLAAQAFMRHASYATTQQYYGHHIKVRLDKVQLTLPSIQPFQPTIVTAASA